MTTVTRNCEYSGCDVIFTPVREHQRFCSPKCRVYASRYDTDGGPSVRPAAGIEPADESIGAALQAARNFTPIVIPDHKTVAAIRVRRPVTDPNLWEVAVPANSVIAAGRIHEALSSHIGDLMALANRLGEQAGFPRLVLQTRAARRK